MKSVKIRFVRGDGDAIKLFEKGDYTQSKLTFSINENDSLTALNLLSKNNALNGGSADEFDVVFDSAKNRSEFIITLLPADTEGWLANDYFFSITATDKNDASKSVTLFTGPFVLLPDGENVFNGIINVADLNYLIAVLAKDLTAGQYARVVKINGANNFEGVFLFNSLFESDENMDIMGIFGASRERQQGVHGLFEFDAEGNLQDNGGTITDDFLELISNEITLKV